MTRGARDGRLSDLLPTYQVFPQLFLPSLPTAAWQSDQEPHPAHLLLAATPVAGVADEELLFPLESFSQHAFS